MADAILIGGANGLGRTTSARQLLPLEYPEALFPNADEIQRESVRLSHPVEAGRELLRGPKNAGAGPFRSCDHACMGRAMTVDSTSSTTVDAERERKLARLVEAARRAVWDATEGPQHLRKG